MSLIKSIEKSLNKKENKEVKILNRKESVIEIKKLIKYAKESLILISPYVDLSESYMEEIIFCKAKKKCLIYRLDQFIEDYHFLKENDFLLGRVKNLHSKIYMNENYIIFSSMNLVDYSMNNNFEHSIMIKTSLINEEESKKIIEIIENSIKC